jgi:hypothetical protein
MFTRLNRVIIRTALAFYGQVYFIKTVHGIMLLYKVNSVTYK